VKDIHESSSNDESEDELSDDMSELSINANALVKRILVVTKKHSDKLRLCIHREN
jgi:hypothetical protein